MGYIMIKYLVLPLILLSGLTMAQDIDLANMLYYNYQSYKEPSLTKRRFKHSDISSLIQRLKNNDIFTVNKIGESAENRSIFLISFGTGKTKIFLWSQMHGDESTATMALFDILNFLSANDNFNEFRQTLLEKTTIYLIPMVNPDGAELFQRRNIYDIDINRDASRFQTPEGKILKEVFDNLKADFGFNLHDQKTRYSAGHTFKSATLSFLAPPVNNSKEINSVRRNAMKLIGEIFNTMSGFIPGHIAKYKDDFEPRAFGDNFQKSGTSTILIESGGWKDDTEKQFIRKMNFIALLASFKSIAEKSYENEKLDTYENIPLNEEDLFDLILRNLKFKSNGSEYLIDLGIARNEINIDKSNDFYYKSILEEKGDLSVYFGYEDYDFTGMEIKPGKTYEKVFSSISEIKKLDICDLYKNGYTNVLIKSDKFDQKYTNLPINIVLNSEPQRQNKISLEESPNYIIVKDEQVRYVVINGFLYNVIYNTGEIINGIIL